MQDQLKGPSRTWWDLATACDRRVRENQIEGPWLPRRSRDYRRSVEPRAEISNRSAVNTTSAGVPYYTSVEHFDAYFLEWGRFARASLWYRPARSRSNEHENQLPLSRQWAISTLYSAYNRLGLYGYIAQGASIIQIRKASLRKDKICHARY